MEHLLAVGLGGAAGAMTRVLCMRLLPAVGLAHFPLPIFVINVIGCFLMGICMETMALYWSPTPAVRSFVTTGFLGGFTTFSAFSLEFALLTEKNLHGWAFFYATSSVICSILAFFIGSKFIKGF